MLREENLLFSHPVMAQSRLELSGCGHHKDGAVSVIDGSDIKILTFFLLLFVHRVSIVFVITSVLQLWPI